MKRIQNFAGLNDSEISHLAEYLHKKPDEATATNLRKSQSVFEATFGGKPLIVKQYIHRALKHRLASFGGQSNADRYCSVAKYLGHRGLPVPSPVLLLKTGPGFLPERSLYVMERVDGEMLYHLLPSLEANSERIRIVAKKVAALIASLRESGVVHRDLNTKNFLVSPGDEIHLIDFDYASHYRIRGERFARRHERDIHSFLSTCLGAPKLAAAVRSSLCGSE